MTFRKLPLSSLGEPYATVYITKFRNLLLSSLGEPYTTLYTHDVSKATAFFLK